MHILHTVQLGQVTLPLFDQSSMPAGCDNAMFLKEYLSDLLSRAFPNVVKQFVNTFIVGLFDVSTSEEAFKQHVRDFLVQCKEFSVEDNSELFAEEEESKIAELADQQWQYRRSVPGLLNQNEVELDPDL